ncbi:tumor protein D55-like isoform X3 [Oratosquilla oratoria]|uniref:tumor protein D55-like isoform X3 n=2 Tax=Oratosquilla oratoria TaxID=337810 RepID=UPI003F776A90
MSTTPVSAEVCYDAVTPDSGVHENFSNLSPEDQEKQREEWKSDLVKTEEEIQMLRQVLGSKIKQAQDLKRRLGITVWREFTDDFNASLKSVRESQTSQYVKSFHVYQKTAGALSAAGEKTSSLFGGLGAKIGQIKETPTFKSFEERVGSAYNSARATAGLPSQTRMGGSRSNSTQNFEDALKEAEGEKAANGSTPATTPSANTDEMQQQQQQAAS